jgi:hypothetical protein
MFLNCSTCFERHTTYHPELKNCYCSLWFYICLWLPAAVSSWWWAVCRSKHVEQLRNAGIISSTTRSHLVGYFYTILILDPCIEFLVNITRRLLHALSKRGAWWITLLCVGAYRRCCFSLRHFLFSRITSSKVQISCCLHDFILRGLDQCSLVCERSSFTWI